MIDEELGLVDKMIYESYKDKCINGTGYFKRKIKQDYGLIPSSDLYRKIVNYQIKKYGKQLTAELRRDYEKEFYEKNFYLRKCAVYRSHKSQMQRQILERLENEKIKNRNNK